MAFILGGDLGQNFLIDLNLVEFVVNEAELTDQDVVLEIGAGTGSMTTMMAARAGAVVFGRGRYEHARVGPPDGGAV